MYIYIVRTGRVYNCSSASTWGIPLSLLPENIVASVLLLKAISKTIVHCSYVFGPLADLNNMSLSWTSLKGGSSFFIHRWRLGKCYVKLHMYLPVRNYVNRICTSRYFIWNWFSWLSLSASTVCPTSFFLHGSFPLDSDTVLTTPFKCYWLSYPQHIVHYTHIIHYNT